VLYEIGHIRLNKKSKYFRLDGINHTGNDIIFYDEKLLLAQVKAML